MERVDNGLSWYFDHEVEGVLLLIFAAEEVVCYQHCWDFWSFVIVDCYSDDSTRL